MRWRTHDNNCYREKNGKVVIAADSLITFGSTRLSPIYDALYDKVQLLATAILVLQVVQPTIWMEIYASFNKIHSLLKDDHFLNPKE